jgi:hypothetical protein
MPAAPLQIVPATKVGELLDAYPQLEEILVRMAPPFKKLKNPILRKSIAKVASLKQAAVVGRLELSSMINELREAVGQPPLEGGESISEQDYLGTVPAWFSSTCVAATVDDRDGGSDEMAINRVVKELRDLNERQVVELLSTFVPAPGIDVARKRGMLTWTVKETEQLYKTYFTRSD